MLHGRFKGMWFLSAFLGAGAPAFIQNTRSWKGTLTPDKKLPYLCHVARGGRRLFSY